VDLRGTISKLCALVIKWRNELGETLSAIEDGVRESNKAGATSACLKTEV